MDIAVLCQHLNIPPESEIAVLRFALEDWGRELRFDCRATPPDGTALAFALWFHDCRDLRWRFFTHHEGESAALVDLLLGTGQHRKPANLLTEAFGATVLYGGWEATVATRTRKSG
jgi:hypothetical protein